MELPSLSLEEVRRQKRDRNPARRAQHPYASYSEAKQKAEYVSSSGAEFYFPSPSDPLTLTALLPIAKRGKASFPEENTSLLLYHLPTNKLYRASRVSGVISHPRRKTARVELLEKLEYVGRGTQENIEWAYPTYKSSSP